MKLQCKACPALASSVLPYPSLRSFTQPNLPTLQCCVVLTLLLVLTWSINWWNIQQNCGNFLNFIAFFGRYLLTLSVNLSFTPSFFWKWNVLRWYICNVSFIYIWLVLSKFSIYKCFGNCRKDNFRLLLGGFLTLAPPNSNDKVMHQICNCFYWTIKKWSKLSQKTGFLAHFQRFFNYTPLCTEAW